MQRQSQNKKEHAHHSLSFHLTTAGAATFFLHPLRVMLNRASFHVSPIATIKDALGYMYKGAALNITRGALSTGLQSTANHTTQRYLADKPNHGRLAGLMAASFIGTLVASFVEVPFMRKTTATSPVSLFKFNRPISTYFFMREIGFSGAAFISKDFSTTAHYSILLSAAWITASCHKLAMIEATKDLMTNQYTVPDYAKGMRQAIQNIGYGVYTHPSLRPLVANPSTLFHRSANVLYSTCGPNMFLFRLLYLKGFAELLVLFKNKANEIEEIQDKLNSRKK